MSWLVLFSVLLLNDAPGSSEPLRVSIIELVANPERFEGKQVVTMGYIDIRGDEDQALFLHCDDLRNWVSANSVRIAVPDRLRPKVKRGQLVYLSGTFSMRDSKRWSRWPSGQITDILVIDPVRAPREAACSVR